MEEIEVYLPPTPVVAVPMMDITVDMLKHPLFAETYVHEPNHLVALTCSDGSVEVIRLRVAVFNSIMLHPFFRLNVPVLPTDIYINEHIKPYTTSIIHTHQYSRLMKATDVPYMTIISHFWEAINDLDKFIHIHLANHQRSIGLMDMTNVMEDPNIKKLNATKLDSTHGTMVAEKKFGEISKELIRLLSCPNAIRNNTLLTFMQAGALNVNQIPQFMLAYGPRSDIDDQMMRWVINVGGLEGLQCAADFAIETLSAKKTAFYNMIVIANTQYFARVLRLMNMQFRRPIAGDCGSTYLLPHSIMAGSSENYVGKIVRLDGREFGVTDDNHTDIDGKIVEMISPVGCKYTDGVCERCAGRDTDHPWAYIPNVHLGSYAKSKLSSMVSQNVLSAKHLIKTMSVEPSLFSTAKKYFFKETSLSSIMFHPNMEKRLKNLAIVVPEEDMRPISDLQFGIETPAGFSCLEDIELLNIKDETQSEIITIADSKFMIHFSMEMLEHIHKYAKNVEHSDGMLIIPLKGFDIALPVLSYVVVNDDMVAFSKRIKKMLSRDISQYSSVAQALQSLTDIIYAKKGMNVFWLELIIKSLMIDTIDHEADGVFRVIDKGIEDTSVATKLGHETLKKYLQSPATSVVEKGDSPLDLFFTF